MTRPSLPPLPILADLTTSPHPVLADTAARLAELPDVRCAFYEDSPYVHFTRSEEAPS